VAKGARVLAGGSRIGDKGFFLRPTVLADCNHEMEVMREETFRPLLAFMKIGGDLDQAFEYANDTVFGLSAYFFSRDARNCYLAAKSMDAGSVWINDIHGSYVQAPYGGMKMSGIGREQGSIAIDDYLEWKTVYQEMSYESRAPGCACTSRRGAMSKPVVLLYETMHEKARRLAGRARRGAHGAQPR